MTKQERGADIELAKELEQREHPLLVWGSGVSDIVYAGDTETADEYRTLWLTLLYSFQEHPALELQLEKFIEAVFVPHFPKIEVGEGFVGVHQPTSGRDLLSDDPVLVENSMRDTLRAMEVAEQLGASYFVLHAVIRDNWNNRPDQLIQATEILRQIIDHYLQQDYSYRLLIENLEFPKQPSLSSEIVNLIRTLRQWLPSLGLALDIPHHWHNEIHLLHQVPDYTLTHEDAYFERLQKLLTELEEEFPGVIEVIHLAQAYIDENDGIHNTHALPGTQDVGDVRLGASRYQKPTGFYGKWLDLDKTIQTLAAWAIQSDHQQVKIVQEVHHRQAAELELSGQALAQRWEQVVRRFRNEHRTL